MDIFEALRADHETQRTLVDLLVKTHGDSDGRHELFEKLKSALSAHAAAEERHFYAPLMHSDTTQKKVRHSVAEHHELDELLEQLTDTDYSSPGWLPCAKQLRERVHHHLDEEEREVFQLAGKTIDAKQKETLAKAYQAEMGAKLGT